MENWFPSFFSLILHNLGLELLLTALKNPGAELKDSIHSPSLASLGGLTKDWEHEKRKALNLCKLKI